MPQDNRIGNVKITMANFKRKNPKPILEKKRRARINESLSELKTLLVEVLQKEGCRHSSKMEKADVIEMAVRHLKNLQKQKNFPGTKAPSLRDSYPPAIPVEKYASSFNPYSFSPDCLSLPMKKFIARSPTEFNSNAAVGTPHPRRSDTMVTSQRIANRDYNYNILSALLPSDTNTYALPVNSNVSGMSTAALPGNSIAITQSMMTRAVTGDIALDLSQNLLKQAAAIQRYAGDSPYKKTQLRVDTNIPSIPLWSYLRKPVSMPTLQQSQCSAFTSLPSSSSTTSSSQSSLQSPVSPVWRPWR